MCVQPPSLSIYTRHIRRRWIGPTPHRKKKKKVLPLIRNIYIRIIRWKNKFQSPPISLGFLCVWLFSHYLSVVFNWQKWNIPEKMHMKILYVDDPHQLSVHCMYNCSISAQAPRGFFFFLQFSFPSYGGSQPEFQTGKQFHRPLKYIFFSNLSFFLF